MPPARRAPGNAPNEKNSQIRELPPRPAAQRPRFPAPQESDDKGERKLEVSGTPEQCQAAHHLVNSYLAMGRAPPAFPVMG